MAKKEPRVVIPVELLKVGEPTINKRTYSKEAIQKLVETGGKRAREGRLLVEDRRDTKRSDELMDIRKVVGVAKDVKLVEGVVIGTVDVLADRPDGVGEVVRILAESGQGRFFPIGKGTVKKVDGVKTVQDDYKMTGIGFEYDPDYQGEIVQLPESAVPQKPTLVDKDKLDGMIDTALEDGATFRDPPSGQTFVADVKYPEKDAEPKPQPPTGEAKKLAEMIVNAPTAKAVTATELPDPIGPIKVPALHDFDSPREQSIREMASQPVEPEPEPEAESTEEFSVVCSEQNNPPESMDSGSIVCDIEMKVATKPETTEAPTPEPEPEAEPESEPE